MNSLPVIVFFAAVTLGHALVIPGVGLSRSVVTSDTLIRGPDGSSISRTEHLPVPGSVRVVAPVETVAPAVRTTLIHDSPVARIATSQIATPVLRSPLIQESQFVRSNLFQHEVPAVRTVVSTPQITVPVRSELIQHEIPALRSTLIQNPISTLERVVPFTTTLLGNNLINNPYYYY